jgi:hypothetical protein
MDGLSLRDVVEGAVLGRAAEPHAAGAVAGRELTRA